MMSGESYPPDPGEHDGERSYWMSYSGGFVPGHGLDADWVPVSIEDPQLTLYYLRALEERANQFRAGSALIRLTLIALLLANACVFVYAFLETTGAIELNWNPDSTVVLSIGLPIVGALSGFLFSYLMSERARSQDLGALIELLEHSLSRDSAAMARWRESGGRHGDTGNGEPTQ